MLDFTEFNDKTSLQNPVAKAIGREALGDAYKKLRMYKQSLTEYEQASELLKKAVKSSKVDYFQMKVKFKIAMSLYYQGEMDQSIKCFKPVKEYLMKLNHQETKVQHKLIKANFYIGKATLSLMGPELRGEKYDYNEALRSLNFCIREDFDPEIHDLYSGNSHFEIAKIFLKERDVLNCYDFMQRANDNNFASKRMSLYRDFSEGVV